MNRRLTGRMSLDGGRLATWAVREVRVSSFVLLCIPVDCGASTPFGSAFEIGVPR